MQIYQKYGDIFSVFPILLGLMNGPITEYVQPQVYSLIDCTFEKLFFFDNK